MTSIKDLLDPEQAAAIKQVLIESAGSGRAYAARNVEDDVQVTTINGVEFDMRSGAMVETTCADCPAGLHVEVTPEPSEQWLLAGRTRQEFHDLLCSEPRVAVCTDCGRKRVAGKRGTLIHQAHEEKPMPEIILTDYTEAEVAAMAVQARARMVAAAEAEIPAKREKAVKAEKARVKKDEAKKKADRASRKAMPGFVVKGKEVPALDLRELTNLHETMSPKVRSPYNKALNAIKQPLLDPETTTWQVLAETHAYLLLNHADGEPAKAPKVKAKKKGKKAKKGKREVLIAVLDADAKAKIEAFARIYNLTPEAAEQRLVAAGVL